MLKIRVNWLIWKVLLAILVIMEIIADEFYYEKDYEQYWFTNAYLTLSWKLNIWYITWYLFKLEYDYIDPRKESIENDRN